MRPVRDNFVERIRVLPTDGSRSIVAARVSGAGSSAGTKEPASVVWWTAR